MSTTIEVPSLPATGYIRQKRLLALFIPFSAATLWRKVGTGDFPKPIKLSKGVTAWKVEDIRAWMLEKEAQPG